VSAVLEHALVIYLFLKMTENFDEAASFVFVQLIEQERGIYDKWHPDYGRQDKIDLAWETVTSMCGSCSCLLGS
jgi:hypothetical protein